MQFSRIAHVTAFAGLLVACSGGGSGSIEGSGDPGGPFSGMGNPGRSIFDYPGMFVGSGAPGVGGSSDISNLLASVCSRAHASCPGTSAIACVESFQSGWDKLVTDCERGFYYALMTCLLSANFTCNASGQATTQSCAEPPISACRGGTTGTGGTGGGTGGGGTGGAGGTGGGTGGTGATGGTGGTGGMGGTGGGTGGAGGRGGGGTGGTGGGGRGGRDGGRG